jgi:aconitate decarboxylase
VEGRRSGGKAGGLAGYSAAGAAHGLDGAGFEDALGTSAPQSGGLMAAQFESMVK